MLASFHPPEIQGRVGASLYADSETFVLPHDNSECLCVEGIKWNSYLPMYVYILLTALYF